MDLGVLWLHSRFRPAVQPRDSDQNGIPVFRKSSLLNASQLLKFFEARRRREEPLVLVTVFDTQGSTYSKAGARMLIDQNGDFQGMLSGGCLEGDLAVRAKIVVESGSPQVVTYDLSQDDELWGLGIGCDGLMRVFLQPLIHGSGYQPFAALADILRGHSMAVATTVIESTSPATPPGATVIRNDAGAQVFGMSDDCAEALTAAVPAVAEQGLSSVSQVQIGDERLLVLNALVEPPPRLLVLGAGLDAEPIVRFASELGWRCTVVDHRQAYIDNGDFGRADTALCVPATAGVRFRDRHEPSPRQRSQLLAATCGDGHFLHRAPRPRQPARTSFVGPPSIGNRPGRQAPRACGTGHRRPRAGGDRVVDHGRDAAAIEAALLAAR